MGAKKNDPTAAETAKTPVNGAKHIYETIDPNEMTSVVNGNRVLFLGKGVREITVTSDE